MSDIFLIVEDIASLSFLFCSVLFYSICLTAAHVDLVTRVGEIMSVGDVYKYSMRRAKRVIVFSDFVKDNDAYRCVPTLLVRLSLEFKDFRTQLKK